MENKKKVLLKVENVGVSMNDKSLVKGVSFEVKQGEIVTLIGPNGSGKSTTAKIALGIYKKIIKHIIFDLLFRLENVYGHVYVHKGIRYLKLYHQIIPYICYLSRHYVVFQNNRHVHLSIIHNQ